MKNHTVNLERLDKLLDSHPEIELHSTIRAYSNIVMSEVNSLSYGDFKQCKYAELEIKHGELSGIDYALVTLPLCSGSDYGGDTVTKANYNGFKDHFLEDQTALKEIYGGHWSYGLALSVSELDTIPDDIWEELIEVLEGLTVYPLINDEDLSNLEHELFTEYIEDNWNQELSRETGIEVTDEIANALFWELYRAHDHEPYPIFETGCIVYFEFDTIIEAVKESIVDPIVQSYKWENEDKGTALTDLDLEKIYNILIRPEEYKKEDNFELIGLVERLLKENKILA